MTASIVHRPPDARGCLYNPLFWLLVFAIAHVCVRVAISPALKWDEAEQMLWSQSLAWGYGAQPPLYTWLQWGVNLLVGPSVLALSALKHTLLALALVFMYQAARELVNPTSAWWTAASLMLLPPLGWYSIRDQTHTVLVTTMTCAAWWILLRQIQKPRPVNFVWLGLIFGMGMLSKYSFALVITAMLLAAISVTEARSALLSKGWWLAILMGALVVLPHALWLLKHIEEATHSTLEKMNIAEHLGIGIGLVNLVRVYLSTVLPWSLIMAWAFRTAFWRSDTTMRTHWAQALFCRYFLLVTTALIAMVLVMSITSFKERWVVPLICVLPMAVFSRDPTLAIHPGRRRFTAAVVCVSLLMLVVAGARPWLSSWRGKLDELNLPIVALRDVLLQQGYDGKGQIIAADHMLAASLRTQFPFAEASTCSHRDNLTPECFEQRIAQAQQKGTGWLLISREDRVDPDWWHIALLHNPDQIPTRVSLPYRYALAGTKPEHFFFVWQPAEVSK